MLAPQWKYGSVTVWYFFCVSIRNSGKIISPNHSILWHPSLTLTKVKWYDQGELNRLRPPQSADWATNTTPLGTIDFLEFVCCVTFDVIVGLPVQLYATWPSGTAHNPTTKLGLCSGLYHSTLYQTYYDGNITSQANCDLTGFRLFSNFSDDL